MINQNIFQLIDAFRSLNVLVIGEAMLDTYLKGSSDRICREAPVPVVEISEREDVPGGAANTAVNTRSLGGEVVFLSVLGDDVEGRILLRVLEEQGVNTQSVLVDPERKTLAKHRVVADNQMMVRFDQGTTLPLSKKTEKKLIAELEKRFSESHALILSDYGYGVLTPAVIAALSRLQQQDPHIIIADSKQLDRFKSLSLTAVKPNYREAIELLQIPKADKLVDRVAQIARHGNKILEMVNTQIAAITLDEDGALIFEKDRTLYRTYARRAPHSRAAGAGDTFVSALALSLASGAQTSTAAEIASAASALVVEKPGTASCFAEELKGFFYGDEKFINDVFLMAARVATYHRQGRKVVFTNGCFDILHSGHVNYLSQAKSFGDILIVGINTDESVARLKGPNRPINNLHDRAQVLAALSSVDLIVPFGADTPKDLIRAIQPDIYVKGGDYTRETLPEAPIVEELGGIVKIVPYMDDHSTTGMIERIRKSYIKSR